MKNEPLVTTSIIAALIGALLLLLRSFGVPITEAQQDAINGVVIIAAPIVVAVIARRYVTPTANPQDDEGTPLTRPDGTPAVARVNWNS